MEDLIKRSDAIRQMSLMLEDISEDLSEQIMQRFGYDTAEELATEAMSIIPSADRPQGEWIVNMINYESLCSVCGAKETAFIYGTEMWYGLGKSKFCPSCGARMKGADDEMQ